MWATTVADLSDRPCHVVDLYSPDRGEWAGVAGPEWLAVGVISLLNAARLDQVDVVGNSVGGIVAQALALAQPDRVRRLVLIGTGANTRGALPGFAAIVDRWIAATRAGVEPGREVAEAAVGALFTGGVDEQTRRGYVSAVLAADPAYLSAVLRAARLLDLAPRLSEVRAPTLVMRGSADQARSAVHAAVLEAHIPDAHSVEIPGAGHSPMVDATEQFLISLRAHLDT